MGVTNKCAKTAAKKNNIFPGLPDRFLNTSGEQVLRSWLEVCQRYIRGNVRDVGGQTEFGFSFDAVPSIDTVLYFRGSIGNREAWRLETRVQVEQAKSIFKLWR